MDLPFLDAAEILGRRWEREEGRDESETEEEEEEEEEGEEDEEEGQPKQRRGKDREWKEIASFASNDLYKESELFTELNSQMTRRKESKEGNTKFEWFICREARRKGRMKCPRVLKVGFPQCNGHTRWLSMGPTMTISMARTRATRQRLTTTGQMPRKR